MSVCFVFKVIVSLLVRPCACPIARCACARVRPCAGYAVARHRANEQRAARGNATCVDLIVRNRAVNRINYIGAAF